MTKYNSTIEQLNEAVRSTASMRQCLTRLGLANHGGNYETTWKRIKEANIDYSHWTGQAWRKGATDPIKPPRPNHEVFVKNRLYNSAVRSRLKCLLPYVCAVCGISQWLDKLLSLHVDHIDGDRYNNELSNLRFLCPNCHSLTGTYCRRK